MTYNRLGREQGNQKQLGQEAESRVTDQAEEEDQSGIWGGCEAYFVTHLPKRLALLGLEDV